MQSEERQVGLGKRSDVLTPSQLEMNSSKKQLFGAPVGPKSGNYPKESDLPPRKSYASKMKNTRPKGVRVMHKDDNRSSSNHSENSNKSDITPVKLPVGEKDSEFEHDYGIVDASVKEENVESKGEFQWIKSNSFTNPGSENAKHLTLEAIAAGYIIKYFINTTNNKEDGTSSYIMVLEKCIEDDGIKYFCIAKLTTNEKTNQHHLKKLGKNRFPICDLVFCGEVQSSSRILYGFIDEKQVYRLCEMKIDENLLRTVVSIPVSAKSTLPLDSRRLFLSYCCKYIYFRETDTRIAIFPQDSISLQSMICLNIESQQGVKKIILQGKEYDADILSDEKLYAAVVRNDFSTDIYTVSKDPQARKLDQMEPINVKAPANEGCNSLELLDVFFLPAYNLLAHVMKSNESNDIYVTQTFLGFKSSNISNYQTRLTIKVDSAFFKKPSNSTDHIEDELISNQMQETSQSYSTSLLRDELTRTANIFLLPQTSVSRILKLSLKFDRNDPIPVTTDHMKIEISSDKTVGQLNIGCFPSDQSGQSKRVCAFPISDRPNCILLLKK